MQIKETCTLLLTFIVVLIGQVSSKDIFSTNQVSAITFLRSWSYPVCCKLYTSCRIYV